MHKMTQVNVDILIIAVVRVFLVFGHKLVPSKFTNSSIRKLYAFVFSTFGTYLIFEIDIIHS